MTKYLGYKIEPVVEMSSAGKDVPDHEVLTYKVSVEDKVVFVGLPSEKSAKTEIDKRIKIRQRMNLAPAG